MASLTELQTLSEQLRGEIKEAEGIKANRIKALQAQSDSLQVDIDQGTSITPTGLSAGAAGRAVGLEGLKSSYLTFRAAGNYLVGDNEEGAELMQRAAVHDSKAARIGQHLVKFDDFVGDVANSYKGTGEDKGPLDLLSDFSELAIYTANQAVPSALDSLAWATAGAVVTGIATGGLGTIPGAVGGLVAKGEMKRQIRNAIVEYGKGHATKEQTGIAQEAFKRAAAAKAKAKFKGAKAGALTSGYIQGASSSFDESAESNVDKQDAAQLAFAMGVPFAVMDVLPEIAFVKSLGKLSGASHLVKGSYLRNLSGGVVKAGFKQGVSELAAETGQEATMIAQRFIQDPNYDLKSATMRMSEAAFAGFVAGKALGSGGKLAGNTVQQVKSTLVETAGILAARKTQRGTGADIDVLELNNNDTPLLNGPTPRQGRTFTPEAVPRLSGPAPRQGVTFTPEPEVDSSPAPRKGVTFTPDENGETRSAGMAFNNSDTSPENMATAPLVDLLAMVQEVESEGLFAADPISEEAAAAAIQELNRRADEMGQNRFQELVRDELNKTKTVDNTPLTRDEEIQAEQQVALNEAEAGVNELREADTADALIGKGKNNDGYKSGGKAIHGRVKKLGEENPGKQYEVVSKGGKEFIQERSLVDDREDVSTLVNEGLKKAKAGTKAHGVDKTVFITGPDGTKTRVSPAEMAHAGMRINNKEKSNDFEADYPQLLLTGFQRMAQEMASLGYVFSDDVMPDSTVVATKGKNSYTWGDLKEAWKRKNESNKSEMSDVPGMNERDLIKAEQTLAELQGRIDKQTGIVEDLERSQGEGDTDGKLKRAEEKLAALQELEDPAEAKVAHHKERMAGKDGVMSTTQEMADNNNAQVDKRERQVDEQGNGINYPDHRTKAGADAAQRRKRSIDQASSNKRASKENNKAPKQEEQRQERNRLAEEQAAAKKQAQKDRVERAKEKVKAKPKPKPKPKPKAETKPKKRTSQNGTTAWGTIPDIYQNYIDAITKTLGITGGINIMYRDEMDQVGLPAEVVAAFEKVFSGGSLAAVVQHKGQRYIALQKLKKDNAYRQAEQIFVLGHEMGHIVMWDMWKALPKAQQDRLWKQFSKERLVKQAGTYTYTDNQAGFEEWFADQTSAWAKKQSEKPNGFSEAFFKKVAKQVSAIFNRSRQFIKKQLEDGLTDGQRAGLRDTKERATLNETFEDFMDAVAGKTDGTVNFILVGDAEFSNNSTTQNKRQRPNNKVTAGPNEGTQVRAPDFKDFSRDPIAIAIADMIDSKAVEKLTELMGQLWKSDFVSQMLKVTLSADQYARTRLGKHGPAFANLFYHRTQSTTKGGDMLNKQHHALDKWNAQFAEVLGEDTEHANKVLAEMQAGVSIKDSVDPKMRQQLADFFERFHREYLTKRITKLGRIRNYFPVVYNTAAIHANSEAFLAELEKSGLNKREAQTLMRAMLENDGAFIEDVPNQEVFGPQFNGKMQRTLKNMDTKAMQDLGFYQDPQVAVQLYLKQATKHAEYNVVKDQAAALIEQMNPKQKAQAQKIVMGYLGRLGAHIDPKWNKFQSYIAALQFATTLMYSVVASFTDIGNPIIRSKDMHGFKSAMSTWRGFMSKQTREEQILFAERIGAASREAVQEALHMAYNSEFVDPGARKWSDRYFKAIGLEQWTRLTRIISANMGRDFVSHHAKKAAAGDKRSARYLAELGLTHEMVKKGYDAETDTLDLTTPEGEAVQEAILNFVDEAIIRPNAAHRPVWASDPHYMLLWQLKSFFYSFGQIVVGGVLREAKSRYKEGDKVGAAMSVGLLFGALMPLAALALQTREMIKGVLGKGSTGDDDSVLEYLFDLVDRAGILGPLSIIKSMFDAGNYGRSGVVSALGPTAGTLETFFTGDTGDLIKRLTPIYSQL